MGAELRSLVAEHPHVAFRPAQRIGERATGLRTLDRAAGVDHLAHPAEIMIVSTGSPRMARACSSNPESRWVRVVTRPLSNGRAVTS